MIEGMKSHCPICVITQKNTCRCSNFAASLSLLLLLQQQVLHHYLSQRLIGFLPVICSSKQNNMRLLKRLLGRASAVKTIMHQGCGNEDLSVIRAELAVHENDECVTPAVGSSH